MRDAVKLPHVTTWLLSYCWLVDNPLILVILQRVCAKTEEIWMCPPEGRVHFIITADINMTMRSRFDSSCDDATSVQCLHIIANAGLCSVLHPSLGISDWLVRAIAVSIYLLLRGDLAPHWSTSTTLTSYWLHIWWFVHKSLSLGHYLFSITLFGCFEL